MSGKTLTTRMVHFLKDHHCISAGAVICAVGTSHIFAERPLDLVKYAIQEDTLIIVGSLRLEYARGFWQPRNISVLTSTHRQCSVTSVSPDALGLTKPLSQVERPLSDAEIAEWRRRRWSFDDVASWTCREHDGNVEFWSSKKCAKRYPHRQFQIDYEIMIDEILERT